MRQLVCVLSLLALFLSMNAAGATYSFIATGPVASGLSPLNENPPHPESSASGTALIIFDTVAHQMTVNVVFSGLTTPNTAAHIHCCVGAPGNAGVATTVPTFTGFPSGATSGTYFHTFDMLSATSYNPAFVSAHGGTVATAEGAFLAGLLAGQTYLNIHTSRFGGGEMRGFLVTPVNISVKPGSGSSPINPKSHGTIPVAILSTTTFDAVTSVDTATLTFGRTGTEQSLGFCNPGGEDVNGDGLLDLVCHFDSQATGFKAGDTLGILTGKTLLGTPILGQDTIRIVP